MFGDTICKANNTAFQKQNIPTGLCHLNFVLVQEFEFLCSLYNPFSMLKFCGYSVLWKYWICYWIYLAIKLWTKSMLVFLLQLYNEKSIFMSACYYFGLGNRFLILWLKIGIESTFLAQNAVNCKSRQPDTRVINTHQKRSVLNFYVKGVCLGIFWSK